jgi:hypothetical protein
MRLVPVFVLSLAMIGCGQSPGSVTAKSEPEARFQGLRSLGETNTKEVIADHKKKALAELKLKKQ